MKGIGMKDLKNLGRIGIRMMNKNLPSILSGFAIFGVAATAYTAFKAAPEVKSALDAKKWDKQTADVDADVDDEEIVPEEDVALTKWETATTAAPYIWKPVACGVFTVGCIVGAQVLNVQRLTMLAGAYKLSEGKLKKYEEKARELLGDKKAEELRTAVAKDLRDVPLDEKNIIETRQGKTIFFDKFSGRYFYSSVEAVRRAESVLNKRIVEGDMVLLNDFYYELGLRDAKSGGVFGWEAYSDRRSSGYVDISLSYDAEEINGEQKVVCIMDYEAKLLNSCF